MTGLAAKDKRRGERGRGTGIAAITQVREYVDPAGLADRILIRAEVVGPARVGAGDALPDGADRLPNSRMAAILGVTALGIVATIGPPTSAPSLLMPIELSTTLAPWE